MPRRAEHMPGPALSRDWPSVAGSAGSCPGQAEIRCNGGDRSVRSRAGRGVGRASAAVELDEAGPRQPLGQVVDRPVVGGGDLVVELDDLGGGEEARDQRPTGFGRPAHFYEREVESIRGHVDQRIPREDPAEGAVGCLDLMDGAKIELDARVGGPSVGDELWSDVDSTHLNPEAAEVRGQVSRSAAGVENLPGVRSEVVLDEREIVPVNARQVVEELDVLLGSDAVRVLDAPHIEQPRT